MNWSFLQHKYLQTTVQDYLIFFLIIIVGFLFKRYISTFFTKVIYKIFKKFWQDYAGLQFKNLILKPLEGFLLTILFFIAIDKIHPALSKIILIKRSSVHIEGGDPITTRLITLQDVVDKLFLFFFIFYFIWLLSRFIDFIFLIFIHKAKLHEEKGKQQVLPLLKDVLKVLVWLFGFFTVLGLVFKVNVSALVAGLGISGIAIAFAARESLENLMASFMLMLDKPFIIGDWIKSGDMEGSVEKIGFRSTRLRSLNKSIIVVPNKKLMDSNVENLSVTGFRRVRMVIKAPEGLSTTNLNRMIEEIQNAVKNTHLVASGPLVFLDNLENGGTSIAVSYSVSLDSGERLETVRQTVNLAIYDIVNKAKLNQANANN